MKRSKQWSKVLDLEIQRWSAMPYEELLSALKHVHTYEIEMASTKYQVEDFGKDRSISARAGGR